MLHELLVHADQPATLRNTRKQQTIDRQADRQSCIRDIEEAAAAYKQSSWAMALGKLFQLFGTLHPSAQPVGSWL